MKVKLSKRLRSGLAMLLAIVMVVGMLPASALAAEVSAIVDDTTINYVSLGDSMTNGYGLDDEYEHNGYNSYAVDAYPNQFANWLGNNVKHYQYAMSGMRVEDLHFTLELDYDDPAVIAFFDTIKTGYVNDYGSFKRDSMYSWDTIVPGTEKTVQQLFEELFPIGDLYTYDEFIDGRFDYYDAWEGAPEGTLKAAEAYQTAVENADIISVGIGNGNFGVFMLGRIMEAIGFDDDGPLAAMQYDVERALAECEPEMQDKILMMKEVLYADLETFVGGYGMSIEGDPMMEALVNTIVYTAMSFALNYAGTLERIMELNPDAEVILVGIMNTFAGIDATMGGAPLPFSMTDLMGVIVKPANAFIAAIPTMMQGMGNGMYDEGTFYYAEAPEVECVVETYSDEIYNPYNKTVRDRFITEIVGNGYDKGMIWGLAGGLLGSMGELVYITREEIETYEAAMAQADAGDVSGLLEFIAPMMSGSDDQKAAARNKLISIIVYLGFEQCVLDASEATTLDIAAFASLAGGDLASAFAPLMYALAEPQAEDFETVEEYQAAMAIYNESLEIIAQYNDIVYALVAAMSSGYLTAEQVERLVKGGDEAEAVYYEIVAGIAGIDAEEVDAIVNKTGANDALYKLVVANLPDEYGWLTVDMIKAVAEESDGDAANAVYYKLVEQTAGLNEGDVANVLEGNPAGKTVLYGLIAKNLPAEYNWLTVDMIKAIAEEPDGDVATAVYYKMVEQTAGLNEGDVANVLEGNPAGKTVLYGLIAKNLPAEYNWLTVDMIKAIAEEPDGDDATTVYYKLAEKTAGLNEGDVANIIEGNSDGMTVLFQQVADELEMDAADVGIAYNNSNSEVVAAVNAAKETVSAGVETAKTTATGLVSDGLTTANNTITSGISTAKTTATDLVGDGLVTAERGVVDGVATAKTTVEGFDIEGNAGLLGLMVGMPEVLPAAAAKDFTLTSLLHLFARMMIGNGLGAHPSAAGHDDLYDAVKASYNNGYTAEDETDKRLEEIEHAPVAKEIYLYLAANDYIDEHQTLDIAWFVYQQYRDDQSLDGNLFDIIDFIYSTLFNNEELNDDDRLAIISGVYNILKAKGYLAPYAKYLDIVEDLCEHEVIVEKVSPEQTFAIVDCIYDALTSDEPLNVRAVAYEIYFKILAVKEEQPAVFMLRMAPPPASLTPSDKLDILEAVYEVLKDNEILDTSDPDLQAAEDLYFDLVNGEIVSDELALSVFDAAIEAVLTNETLTEEVITNVATEIVEKVLGEDSELSAEAKGAILNKVMEALENSSYGEVIPTVPGLDVTVALKNELQNEGYLTNEQAGQLIEALYPVLTGDKEPDTDLADKVYNIVFNQPGQTIQDKFAILMIVYNVLDEYGYIDMGYAKAYEEAKKNGYVDVALGYIDVAIKAVEAGKLAAEVFPVSEELKNARDALVEELKATIQTLEKIDGLLASDALSTKEGAWAEIMALEAELDNHIEKLQTLALEIGFVLDPYVQDAIDAYNYYTKLVADVAVEAYSQFVHGVEEFAAGYAALVEEIGLIADKMHPDLGVAVRKYLTETPAESLAILYAYGNEAATKLIVDAAAAGKDVYTIAAALAKVFYDYGEDIYNELLASGEYKLIVDQIEALKAEIEVVLAKIAAAPADSVSNYEATLGELYAKLMAAYGDVYPIVLQAAGQVDAELPGQIDTLMTALGDTLGVVGNAAGAYGEWFVGRTEAMGGALLTVLVENTDELLTTTCPIIDEIIWAVLNGVNDYLYDTCKAIDAQIWVQIGILEAELKALKAELENAAGEAYEAILAQIAVVEAKLNALKDAVVDGVYTNYLAAVKALGELKTEVINLANALKAAAMDEAAKAYDAIVDALADLEKALPTVLAEALETVKEKLGQFGEYLAGKVVEAVKKYAPELADAIYNYLYNNPDEVIAFFTEYGDEMLALAQEYGDEALAVIGVVLYLYGEDIVDYVVENHEAILGAIAGWIDVHGENTAELIQVYAEALGLCGAVREQIDVLENAVLDLEAKAQAQIAALQAQIDALNAQLQTATGAAKAEIEAKIAELEAQIEAIKAGVEAKIAEVKAAIAELEAAVDAAIKQGLADIAALKAAIENLDEKVAELIEAAKQAAIEEIKAAAANVEVALKNLDATIEQLVGEAYVELKALLADAVDYLIDATVEAVKKYAPELADAIYNYLYHNPDEVIAFFHEYGDEMLALAKEYGDEALAVIGVVLYLYGEEIADYVMDHAAEIMDTMVEWVETHGENAWALIQVYLEELGVIEAIENTVENLVTNLEMMAAGAIEKAEELIAQGTARIEAEIAKLEAAKDALIDELEDLKASLEEELKDASEEVKAEVEKAIAEVEKAIAAVEKAIAELEAKLAELKQIAEDIADAAQKVIDAIAMIGEDFQGAVKALKSALEELADAVEALEEFVAELNAAIDGVQKEIAEIIAVVTEINEKIGEIVAGTIETLEAVEAIINNVVATIREVAAAIDQAVADLKAAVFNAKYVVLPKCVYSDGLNYVALGGTTTKDGGYVDILADILGENFTVSYENHASKDLAYADQLDYVIANAAAIAGADFITYQMDANEIVKNMVDVIIAVNMGGEYTSPDWSEYIDFATVEEVTGEVAATKAEIMKYLDEETIAWIASVEANVIAELEEVLVENGLTDETIELAKPYVESLVYNMVAYAMEAAEAIEAVKTINPTAPVVLVGMYNTLDDVVIKMGGAEINLGDFFAYVVDAVDMYNLIYAVVSGNVTYVDVSEAAVDSAVIDIDEYMGLYVEVEKLLADVEKLTASINPSDLAGMQAIINQINAINAQINALVEMANETYAYFMSIIANTANAEGHTYIAEQIANAILVVEHSPVTGHNCDTCGAKLSDCVDDDHDHNCDICGATMGTHEDTDKDHVCDYGCSETIGTCEDKDPVDGKCDYGCGKDFHPEVSVPEIPVDEDKGVIGFEIDEDAGILFMDTVQTGMSVEDFVALLKLHVDTEYDADGCDVDIVGDVNGLIATGTQVTVSAKNLAGVDSVTYDIVIVGDTNGDGKVSSGDATLIYQHFCGTLINALNELQLLAGDTNGNDRLESGDATKIFAKYVGAGYETVLK